MNFSVYSRNASRAELLLFDGEDDAFPQRNPHRSRDESHVPLLACVRRRCEAGQIYGYRAYGPFDPTNGCALIPPRFCWIHTGVE